MSQRSVHIIVKGKVQGVGYRWFITQKANELNITGWVRNLPNQDVEIIAHGIKSDIAVFLDWIQQGSSRSRILSVYIEDFDSENSPDTFSVR